LKLKLYFEVTPSANKISYQSKTIFLGSCFSDEISSKFSQAGLNVLSNPFGTIFHPLAILHLFEEVEIENTCFQRGDLWFSWMCSGNVYALSKEELISKIILKKQEFHDYLIAADFLFVTFGTSIGYRLKSTNEIVANCHKMPNTLFDKELTLFSEMTSNWKLLIKKLEKLNPNLNVIFTVSPVRHIKDGVVDNNVSKAQLFSLIHSLGSMYFPSFEIVNDELRDYRFFKEDLVHPNDQAIHYVWDKFCETYLDENTNLIKDEVIAVRKMEQHKTLYPESVESLKFQEQIKRKKESLNSRVPNIKW
jgi:hypothetical protein